MVILIATCAVILLATAAELLHGRRCGRISRLAFGPTGRPATWVRIAPILRVLSLGALTWGLAILLLLKPVPRQMGVIPENEYRHLLLVLDVSPSMRLQDAGPTGKLSRRSRAADLLRSFFERVPIDHYRMSILATYTEAKPVVVDTTDMEVVRNILNDLPMEYAFKSGPTNLFAGLEEAVKLARPWRPRSTLLMIISDGDTIPATGMPKLPDAIDHVVTVGVGDVQGGRSIAAHQSRQDASTLRQLAVRLGGVYHDGNTKHLPTELVLRLTAVPGKGVFDRLTLREYALIACGFGTTLLAILPLLLHYFGTFFVPGVPIKVPSRGVIPSSGVISEQRASVLAG